MENVYASFCGENALPYSFEISSSGNFILGCSKPNCLGWANNRGAPSRFYNVNGEVDGFVRELKNFHSFTNDSAVCEENFSSKKCNGDGEWIGGIKPGSGISETDEMLFRCCKHSDLKFAKFFTAFDLKENEKFEGGEVFNEETGEQLYFDYISNIVKFMNDKGVTYEVFVNRLPCIPLLYSHKMVESNITSYKSHNRKKKLDTTKLFQAPTFIAANELLPVVEGGSSIPMQPVLQNNELVNVNNIQAAPDTQIQAPVQNVQVPPLNNNLQPASSIQSFQPMNTAPFYPNTNPSGASVATGGGSNGQSSYYYPINTMGAGGSNPFLCGFLCFSGDTLVTTSNGIHKRLENLKVDEWVLTSGGNVSIGYSRVTSWIHRMPKVEAEFIKFILEDGKHLKITNKHYIYRGNCSSVNSSVETNDATKDMVYAEDIKSTDCLFVQKDTKLIETRISKIETVKEKGIYAPMTDSGNIVVNGILASCYNIEKSSQLHSSLLLLTETKYSWKSIFSDLVFGENSIPGKNEIDIVPGLQTIISILEYVLPFKNI
uniref:Hint domain-containing protein n=1 Tax=Panagrolaimus davidi TaxID=227884 RepID=A0A914R0M2_9BILA